MNKTGLQKIAKSIKEIDVSLWEATKLETMLLKDIRGKLFDLINENGYILSTDYKLIMAGE
jgi:hypothetical protein